MSILHNSTSVVALNVPYIHVHVHYNTISIYILYVYLQVLLDDVEVNRFRDNFVILWVVL